MPDTTQPASGTMLWRTTCGEFGFVVPDSEGECDLLVHRCDMTADTDTALPRTGDTVTYDLSTDTLGPRARNVRRRHKP